MPFLREQSLSGKPTPHTLPLLRVATLWLFCRVMRRHKVWRALHGLGMDHNDIVASAQENLVSGHFQGPSCWLGPPTDTGVLFSSASSHSTGDGDLLQPQTPRDGCDFPRCQSTC